MNELPYYKQLEQIRELLEENLEEFPKDYCQTTTRLVELITGLEGVGGYHFGSTYIGPHFWNPDTERKLYVDLTLDQFGDVETPISILPDSTEVLEKDPGLTAHYFRGCNNPYVKIIMDELCKLYEERYGKVCPVIGGKEAVNR